MSDRRRVPAFPLLDEPGDWDALTLLAGTVFLEAEGEPVAGKDAVAWVVRNRCDAWKLDPRRVILGPDAKAYDDGKPYEAWSCWNDDYRAQATARLSAADLVEAELSWRAAAGALWRLIPDTTAGATHYLNVPLTKQIRGGSLPSWFDEGKVVATIGRHTFLRS